MRSKFNSLTKLAKKYPFALASAVLLVVMVCACIFYPLLSTENIREANIENRLCPPSSMFILGCDLDGRSVWLLLLAGGRITLIIAGLTVLLSSSLGIFLGAVAGYFGGALDLFLMRVVDIVLSVPQILLALVVISILGPSHLNVILVLIATGWAPSARLVRAQILSVKEREFVKAAEAFGASTVRIFIKHLLPQTISPLLVHATFSAAAVIIVESSLSFLGLSANTEIPTWGGLLNQGKTVMYEAPHLSVFPGLVIMLFVLSLNFIGDAMRDEFDPRSETKKA